MTFNISDFRSNMSQGGARPTLFDVYITNPVDGSGDQKLTFSCKAAQLPGSTIGNIDLPFKGRKVKIAGDRTFEPWTVTIMQDEDFVVRSALERWHEAINGKESNLNTLSPTLAYKNVNATVTQYGKDGRAIRQYTFDGIYPSVIAPVELSWESTDQIEEYQVTFEYDFWRLSELDATGIARTIGA